MHWSEIIANELITKKPDKEEYVCAAGISPSGSVHIGNFRDIATSYFVCRALQKAGKKAKLLFSWDEFDRFRKVPKNVSEAWSAYIGKPYVDVPDPFGCCGSYAEHFEKEFERSLSRFGIAVDFRYQATEYRSGRYNESIIHALRHRGEIFDILDSFRTQDAAHGEREAYSPAIVYCPSCGKDTTTFTSFSEDCTTGHFNCKCGYEGDYDFVNGCNAKLAWKIDWPMRWKAESVDFEPGGKDHASPTGSYQTSRIISDKIYDYSAPYFTGYEFIGIKGMTGKMSGSSGLNLTPETLLKIYQPEVILWLYSKTEPLKAFDFCFDEEILRQYFEFDKSLNDYRAGTGDARLNAIMYNVDVAGHAVQTVPMSQLVQLGSTVDFNLDALETVFEKIGTPYKREAFAERLTLAQFWLENCSPENAYKLRNIRDFAVYNSLSDDEKQEIKLLFEHLSTVDDSLDDLNTFLYAVSRTVFPGGDEKEIKRNQGRFFKNVYRLLLNKERGPRLYLFLHAIDKGRYLPLLDFSAPASDEELAAAQPQAPEIEAVPKDAAEPLKAEIAIDDFAKLDFRVCEVLECVEVPKTRNLLKLTLDDGLGGRQIVSSIKGDYQPEQLVGRKIIVVANLKPAKFAGQKSQGMLLAATSEESGCKVIFVDDAVPTGTAIG
ncbi:MAG: lysine--tRNA ligase [Candidatus Fimivivens sp.]